MSNHNDIDIVCERCTSEFRGTIWTAIHAGEDPELKDILLGGELNMVMCPQCAHVSYQDHFVLYQDPQAEVVAYVYPPTAQPEVESLTKMMFKGFEDAQLAFEPKDRLTYSPVLMFGLESLVEMMTKETDWEEQADVAEAVCKEGKIAARRLGPYLARTNNLPRVLPGAAGATGPTRAQLLKGIDQLLTLNPTLTIYADLKKRVSADAGWKFNA